MVTMHAVDWVRAAQGTVRKTLANPPTITHTQKGHTHMARNTTPDPIEISTRMHGPRNARVLTVYIAADNIFQVEESGIGRANVVAHKKGYAAYGDNAQTKQWPVEKSQLTGQWITKIEYCTRWRGRSTLDRKAN